MVEKLTVKEKDSRLASEIDDEWFLRKQVESWNGKHIARWIEGLGDTMNPFLGILRDNLTSGRHLSLVDNDLLLSLGISGIGARKMILQAVQLLQYFCNEAPNENLQSLALKTSIACRTAAKSLLSAQKLRKQRERNNEPIQKAELVGILNNLTKVISNLTERSKRLIFWLDRSPFDENPIYINLRDEISESIWSIVRSVNVQPRVLFEFAGEIVKKMQSLRLVCDQIVYKSNDPAILYTANYEAATLQRSVSSRDWGINVQSSYLGVHVISDIKEDSPADRCGKIDAGDEIMMINGKTVIGWDLTRVAQRLGQKNDDKLRLIVNKRPRDTVPILIKNAPKAVTKPLAKMAPGSQTGYSSALERAFNHENFMFPLNRRRSSTFIGKLRESPVSQPQETAPRIARRASISCGRECEEIPEEVDRPQFLQWNLNDILPSFETRVVRRARTMRHQPDGYVRSFIDNKLVQEVEEDVVVEQLPYNVKCPTEFAKITVVDVIEMAQHGLTEPKITDPEWSAPPNDITTHRVIVPIKELNVSTPGLDSPRGLNPFHHDSTSSPMAGVLPSPSTSSMNSLSSPAPLKLMSLNTLDWGSGPEVPLTPLTPMTMMSNEKHFEGWARRRKTGQELSEATNKWPKCWMVLRGPYLSCYTNQYSQHPDFTINVTKCTVSDQVDIKTSKKFVFRLQRPSTSTSVDYYFSCFNGQDQKAWIGKIVAATETYQCQNRVMSKSMSYFKEGDGDSHSQHYNTLTGLPSLMTNSASAANSPDAISSPGAGNTGSLPRSGFLSSLTSRASNPPAVLRPKKL